MGDHLDRSYALCIVRSGCARLIDEAALLHSNRRLAVEVDPDGIYEDCASSAKDDRPVVGLKAARAGGRKGGRKFALSGTQVRLAHPAMASRDIPVAELCRELGIGRWIFYRYPPGRLRLSCGRSGSRFSGRSLRRQRQDALRDRGDGVRRR